MKQLPFAHKRTFILTEPHFSTAQGSSLQQHRTQMEFHKVCAFRARESPIKDFFSWRSETSNFTCYLPLFSHGHGKFLRIYDWQQIETKQSLNKTKQNWILETSPKFQYTQRHKTELEKNMTESCFMSG